MKSYIPLLLLLCSALFVEAQEPLSLNEAIAKALENNYNIRIVKENQRISEINNNWGTAGRYPYINLNVGNDNSANINENENYTSNRFSAGAVLNWTLFDGYSVRINKTRFEELEALSKNNTAIMVEGTIQSVILTYYDVLLQKEILNTYKEIMTLSEDRYKQAQDRKQFGTAVTYDVLQAQNSYLSDRGRYLLQEVALKNASRDLNYFMAENMNTKYDLTEKFEAKFVNYSLSDLQAQLTANNRTLQNQYVNQRLLENAVAAAKSNFSPSLDFRGGVTGNSNATKLESKSQTWANSANFYGNFTLSLNIFSGGNRKRAVQIAKINEETGMVKIDEMTHDLNNRLSNLYEFYEVRKELLNVADENLEAAKLNLEISRDKYNSGTINSFNFRDVQTLYLNAAQARLVAVYAFIDTHTALLRMTGAIIQQYE